MITIPTWVAVVFVVMWTLDVIAKGYFLCNSEYPRTVLHQRWEDIVVIIIDTALISLVLTGLIA